MSEQRFKSTIDEETMSIMPYLVSDNEEEAFYNLQGCVNLLNEQQAKIHRDEMSIKTMMSNMEKLEKENEQLKEENEQLSKELKELEKNFEDLVDWSTKISKRNVVLDERIGRLQQEEKLYAQEILRLNTLLKQYQANQDLGGGY